MIFCNMQTQWSTSFGGFVGLRYEVLLMQGGMFDLYNIVDRRKILEELQIMEATALKYNYTLIRKRKKLWPVVVREPMKYAGVYEENYLFLKD